MAKKKSTRKPRERTAKPTDPTEPDEPMPDDPDGDSEPDGSRGTATGEPAVAPRIGQNVRSFPGTREFWLGALPGGPSQNYILGGYCLHMESGGGARERGKPAAAVSNGQITKLDKGQVEAIMKDARRQIATPVGKHGRTKLNDLLNRYYQRANEDLPVGCFVYIVAVEDVVEEYGANWFREMPHPLYTKEEGPGILTKEIAVVKAEVEAREDERARRAAKAVVAAGK